MANDKEITIKVQLDGTKGVVKDSSKIQHSIRDIGDDAEESGQQMQGFGAGTVAAGALAAGALNELRQVAQQALRESYRLATSSEETASKYRTVLGPSIGIANEFLEENSHLMGLSRMEGQEMVATTTAIAQGFGFTGDEAAELGTDVMQLAGDLQSFNDVPIEQTHNAITTALSGEREALKTLGIVIRETDVQQRALEQTGRDSADALTQQEKATATLSLITERAGKAVGDLNRTQDSTANKARRAAAEYRTLAESVSRMLLPAFDSGVNLALGLAQGLNEMIEVPVVEELKSQRDEFNALYTEATNVNTSQQERIRLIRRMKQEYPEFLEGIDAEKVSNQELSDVLQEVNEAYENRIDIQNILSPVQEKYEAAVASSERVQQKESDMLVLLEKKYRDNADALSKLGFETENWRERLQQMDGAQAQQELTLITTALDDWLSKEQAIERVGQSVVDSSINPMSIALLSLRQRRQQLNSVLEEARTQLENLGFSQERINNLLQKYRLEVDQATDPTTDYSDTLQFMADLMSGDLYSGIDKVNTGTDNLSEKIKINKDRINELINKTDTLTQSERNEVKALAAQNRAYQNQIDKRKELLALPDPASQQVNISVADLPEEEQEFDIGSGEFDPQAAQQWQQRQEQLQREKELADQLKGSLSTVKLEYDSVTAAATSGLEKTNKGLGLTQQQWAAVGDRTGQAAGQAVMYADTASEAIRSVIEGVINQVVALWVRNALQTAGASGPLALALSPVLAAGAVKAAKGLMKPLLDFQRGGVLQGPSHARGGIPILQRGQPIAEAEGDEAIINTRSTRMFYDELSAINQAGGGRAFPGSRMQTGGPLGPVPSRPEGGFPSPSRGIDNAGLAAAVQQGMENANVVARLRDDIADLHDKLTDYREQQNLIGN